MPSTSSRVPIGTEIPLGEPHALSVSLPTWTDNLAWASGNEDVIKCMSTGYPRFFVHRKILELADIILKDLHVNGSLAHLFPTAHAAQECVAYMRRYVPSSDDHSISVGLAHILLDDKTRQLAGRDSLEVYAVIFRPELKKLGKSYWQHTGTGVSSRYASACLANIANRVVRPIITSQPWEAQINPCVYAKLHSETQRIAQTLQRRIASLALTGSPPVDQDGISFQVNGRGKVSETDVFLYPSGMSAIWHAHQLIMKLKPGLKYVSFGFPYTDTVKILEKWGPGCIFYGNHPDDNLIELEAFLKTTPTPIAALFCESPSNPLLHSPDLRRLRELADEHGFMIVIDDTIGTFVNVDVLKYVDIVATSLSKLFSGSANVMGGSVVLNSSCPHYSALKTALESSYSNDYFLPDLIQMEENSRDFDSRVRKVDVNARAVCRYLHSHSISYCKDSDLASGFAIKEVFYPEWVTRENYDLVRRPYREDNFGHLFSLTFVSLEASEAFYNTLGCAKGPSLGTNFTLSCPYTLLAHYWERDWAAGFGIEEGLVRVSVGMEELDLLMNWFKNAVEAAEGTIGKPPAA
ncbi:hypothetical protein EUX98_g7243 [Antrodiella citrinella]|uniref:Cystathionine gamma-synthase n=1 Tax=Antrodiella citrinella TaxID=2447956 RepID=A0A4S4MM12_9APHY|nr:hypothetical protein EUX98_g7243 [Antrodiella citrinella]